MLILGIETSCDETAAAVVEDGTTVLSSVIASMQEDFSLAGGVIPEEAARAQVECILPVFKQALAEAKMTIEDLNAIAVTKGPGLLGSLLVGATSARTLSSLWGKPLIGVHHTLGHLTSTWLEPESDPEFPILALSASGGHTDLWYRTAHTQGKLIGRTRDDAAGEAFDKGAALLGLPYPGGPAISKVAEDGDEDAYTFPLPLKDEPGCDFSFSGLKTALKYTLRDLGYGDKDSGTSLIPNSQSLIPNLAASYQNALCKHMINRVSKALDIHPDVKEVHLVGGVSANTKLRSAVAEAIEGRALRWPTAIPYCTDNAAMIAAAAFFLVQEKGDAAYGQFETEASLPLTSVTTK